MGFFYIPSPQKEYKKWETQLCFGPLSFPAGFFHTESELECSVMSPEPATREPSWDGRHWPQQSLPCVRNIFVWKRKEAFLGTSICQNADTLQCYLAVLVLRRRYGKMPASEPALSDAIWAAVRSTENRCSTGFSRSAPDVRQGGDRDFTPPPTPSALLCVSQGENKN